MKSLGRIGWVFAFFLTVASSRLALGADASIDQLLKRLPPPEKLVKPSVERAVKQPDPALRDSMVDEIFRIWENGNTSRALELSRTLVNRYPRSAGAHCLHGVLALDLHQYGEAGAAFRQSVTFDPSFALSHFGLAAVEVMQGHFSAAIPHLLQLGRLEPNSPVVWELLSDCALRVGHKEESVSYARRATAVAPAATDTWLHLARAEHALGHSEGTLNALTHAADVSPDDAAILSLVGFGYINLNRIPQAIPPLLRAARLEPKDFLIQAQLGYCLQATGQLDAGIVHLQLGANLAPKTYGPVWDHLGAAYQKKGQHAEAARAFEKATQIMPQYRLSWQHLAAEYRALGRVADATRAASHAQSLPSSSNHSRTKKG